MKRFSFTSLLRTEYNAVFPDVWEVRNYLYYPVMNTQNIIHYSRINDKSSSLNIEGCILLTQIEANISALIIGTYIVSFTMNTGILTKLHACSKFISVFLLLIHLIYSIKLSSAMKGIISAL